MQHIYVQHIYVQDPLIHSSSYLMYKIIWYTLHLICVQDHVSLHLICHFTLFILYVTSYTYEYPRIYTRTYIYVRKFICIYIVYPCIYTRTYIYVRNFICIHIVYPCIYTRICLYVRNFIWYTYCTIHHTRVEFVEYMRLRLHTNIHEHL